MQSKTKYALFGLIPQWFRFVRNLPNHTHQSLLQYIQKALYSYSQYLIGKRHKVIVVCNHTINYGFSSNCNYNQFQTIVESSLELWLMDMCVGGNNTFHTSLHHNVTLWACLSFHIWMHVADRIHHRSIFPSQCTFLWEGKMCTVQHSLHRELIIQILWGMKMCDKEIVIISFIPFQSI